MSHKPGYAGTNPPAGGREKRMEAALSRGFQVLLSVYNIGFEMGFLEGKRQTTTSSGSAVSAETKNRKRSETHRAAEKNNLGD